MEISGKIIEAALKGRRERGLTTRSVATEQAARRSQSAISRLAGEVCWVWCEGRGRKKEWVLTEAPDLGWAVYDCLMVMTATCFYGTYVRLVYHIPLLRAELCYAHPLPKREPDRQETRSGSLCASKARGPMIPHDAAAVNALSAAVRSSINRQPVWSASQSVSHCQPVVCVHLESAESLPPKTVN
ncbi:hypothetical protein MGYG_07810 [Nannizzia gypsea CBS 118893]|uniref:Uncharacterized protein n=1 Tax=Arthroderma gypseum (strain ATCC MYA-4604 / CBS 118893) TaxID=535722 RepID=E4V479_ARTGP|nr:hypothetical protein MGYG_07810 [Nannizzia gypsea CBS 118893]EFR04803.1 hypothetical protein MGYG_07810 [Nannizzia gypsea CBS 118893]